jgi:SH3-like domain-containing protein
MRLILVFFFFLIQISHIVFADNEQQLHSSETKFLYTRYKNTTMCSSPINNCDVKWIYIRRCIPLKLLNETKHWYFVRDIDESEGWIKKDYLTKYYNYSFIKSDEPVMVYPRPIKDIPNIAFIDPMALIRFEKCSNHWCRIRTKLKDNKSDVLYGWVERKHLWGVD